MPTYYARKSGNVNATDVWATTPTGTAASQTFAAGDVLVANSFTVTVNVSTDLGSTGEVRNDTTGGATAGGSFSLSNGVTLTANVFAGATAACVTLTGSASATVVGNITGGTATNCFGASMSGTGTLTITGSVTGGSGAAGISGTAGTISITGNCTAGAANAVALSFTAAVIVVGNVTGASTRAINLGGGTSATITGNVTGSSTNANGDGVGGSGGPVTITGTATGGNSAVGVACGTVGTWSVTRAKGGPLAGSLVGVSAASGSVATVDEIEYGDFGASPTSGPIRLTDKSSNVAVMYRFGTTKKTLVDANASGLMPTASNVRSGVVYNGGNSTGTMAVPAAGSVALGVPVDNTTGTAALTPAAVWDYATASATTAGSMGERLRNAATVASTGQQIADAVTA